MPVNIRSSSEASNKQREDDKAEVELSTLDNICRYREDNVNALSNFGILRG